MKNPPTFRLPVLSRKVRRKLRRKQPMPMRRQDGSQVLPGQVNTAQKIDLL